MVENGNCTFKSSRDIEKMSRSARRGEQVPSRTELIGHFGQVGVAKVGCSRNAKTERGTKNEAFLIDTVNGQIKLGQK
jgi:hypothetical protein